MSKQIELLFIKGEHRQLGILLKEVKKVIPPLFESDEKQTGKDMLKQSGGLYTMHSFFSEETEGFDSLVHIRTPAGAGEIILGIPGEIEIIKIQLTDIMPMPVFLRSKQQPFFCWAFVKRAEKLVMLVTFSRFVSGVTGAQPAGSR